MKTILTAIALFICNFTFAGISPSADDEYCPLHELYFDITYAGNWDFYTIQDFTNLDARLVNKSYDGNSNITTFHMAINFHDTRAMHSIRIEYYPNGGGGHQADTYTFPKIKSLYNDTRTVNPGIYSITAPYCVTTTTNISFSDLQWQNSTTNTLFGTISQYDYYVPAGWSVNGSVSSGSSDVKHGSHSATIVSDGKTGGQVVIVPVNTACGGTTFSGNPLVIPIIRAEPAPTFSGSATICTSESYTALNIPTWVTDVLWEVTSNSLVTSGSSTSNPATFTKSTDGIGTIKFTMSNPTCELSYSYNGTQITGNPNLIVGAPKPFSLYKESEYCIGGSDWEATFQATPNVGGISYNWKYNGTLDTYNHSSSYYVYEFPADCVNLDVQLVSGCGTGAWLSADYFGNPATFCPSCFGYRMAISPNPTTNQISISSKSVRNPLTIKEVRVVDAQGVVRKVVKANNVKQLKIDISGLTAGRYYVNVYDGKEWVSELVIKN